MKKTNFTHKNWLAFDMPKKIKIIEKFKFSLLKERKKIAELITCDTGKPIVESLSEVDRAAQYIQNCIKSFANATSSQFTYSKNVVDEVRFEPRGNTVIFLSWNFPLLLFAWWVIPNLLAGNTILLKTSIYSRKSTKYILKKLNKAPITIASKKWNATSAALEKIDFVCFTGSSKLGLKLNKILAKKHIPSIMELSGSNPIIICKDAIISDQLLESICKSRFKNAGQTCMAIKRVLVHKDLANDFIKRLTLIIRKIKIGDPYFSDTQMAGLISVKQIRKIKKQLSDALKNGAKLVTGGKHPANYPETYFLPTLLTNIKINMRVWQEEVFGPIIPVMTFSDDDDAIFLANNSPYGLGATIVSTNLKRADEISRKLKVGMVEINNGKCSTPHNPFGGIKDSGHGRQHGEIGFRELCNIKTISKSIK